MPRKKKDETETTATETAELAVATEGTGDMQTNAAQDGTAIPGDAAADENTSAVPDAGKLTEPPIDDAGGNVSANTAVIEPDASHAPEKSPVSPESYILSPEAGTRAEPSATDSQTPIQSEPPSEAMPPAEPAATFEASAAEQAAYTDKTPAAEEMPIAEQMPKPKSRRQAAPRKKTIRDLDLNDLDRDLSDDERREWNAIYASYSAKSVLSGSVIGADTTSFDVRNGASGETERKSLTSLIVIDYRVKVLIPETELWFPGDERPPHMTRGMVGCKTDYIIMEIDREGECAIASRRLALAAKRRVFARRGRREGEKLICNVIAVGAKRCSVELGGYDIQLTQRDLSYTAIPDLRERYRPGQELACILKSYDADSSKLLISVKEVNPNPFDGADRRHPVGSRRQAVISGKYGGGVFCTLPDDTTCLCHYSAQHSDADFSGGDGVIVLIRQYDYNRRLIYGKILAKW